MRTYFQQQRAIKTKNPKQLRKTTEMTKEQGGQKNGIVKANKKHIFHSPRGFFSLKKTFPKKVSRGGARN